MLRPEFAKLDGKTAVITGSSSGLGRAMALEFAAAGANVVVHCRKSVEQAGKVVDEINSHAPGRGELIQADLSRADERERFVDTCVHKFGELDIWVNNAGVDLLTGPEKYNSPEQKLQSLWEIDVLGTFHLSKVVGRRMQQRGSGVILNIGWDQAAIGMAGDSGELFATAKNAIMGFSRSLAVSLAPEVRVNCIAPGWIKTAWGEQAPDVWQERVISETPLKRWGLPTDIAALARFLVSEEASFITGQVINVNGGAVR